MAKYSFKAERKGSSKEFNLLLKYQVLENNLQKRTRNKLPFPPQQSPSFIRIFIQVGVNTNGTPIQCEVASLDMDDFVEGKSYRLVVQRSPLKDKDGSRLRNLSPDPHSRLYFPMPQSLE